MGRSFRILRHKDDAVSDQSDPAFADRAQNRLHEVSAAPALVVGPVAVGAPKEPKRVMRLDPHALPVAIEVAPDRCLGVAIAYPRQAQSARLTLGMAQYLLAADHHVSRPIRSS